MRTLRSILNLGQIGLFSTMNEKNSSTFKHKNTIQLFNRYATYNGSNPYRTPATMNVIAAPEYNQGAFIMEDGMPQVAAVLYQLAQDQGIEFVFNAVVQEIKVQNNQVQGIVVNDTLVQADIVVSNADVHYTYNYLLPHAKKPTRILNQERSTSAMIFYWGMNRTFPEFETHNIFFSDDYRKEFECIEKFSIYEDATAYLFISSKVIPKHAPDGMENWFVLINVPYSHNQDWDAEVARCREILIKKISAVAKADISKNIVTERVNTPKTIERDTFSFAGSLYGPSSNNMMSAFLRHPNYSKEIKDLYFSGGSVHPGGGVPLCILSGKIVADLIKDTPS